MGNDVCEALIGMHPFTGCDTVSAFGGQGKMKALKLLDANVRYRNAFQTVGQDWEVSPELFDIIQEFTCRMYLSRSTTCDVNSLWYDIFRIKQGKVQSGQLLTM